MSATTSNPTIHAREKAFQLYEYRRFASTPGFVNHTPRDTIPSPEPQGPIFPSFARTDVPRAFDSTLSFAPRPCYWNEDEKRRQKKTHLTTSTPALDEEKAAPQPRVPQYEVNSTTADVAQFLRETAPVPKTDAEDGNVQRDATVKRKKSLVRKTARRVLEAGNRQLPEQCQLPQWQRARSPERPSVVAKRSRSGMLWT